MLAIQSTANKQQNSSLVPWLPTPAGIIFSLRGNQPPNYYGHICYIVCIKFASSHLLLIKPYLHNVSLHIHTCPRVTTSVVGWYGNKAVQVTTRLHHSFSPLCNDWDWRLCVIDLGANQIMSHVQMRIQRCTNYQLSTCPCKVCNLHRFLQPEHNNSLLCAGLDICMIQTVCFCRSWCLFAIFK